MSENEKKQRRQRRSFSPEFKAGAVKLVLEEGKSVAEVARDLDLTETAFRKWVEQAKADRGQGKPGALTSEERAELSQLRKRVRQLEKRVARLMRQKGLAARRKRPFVRTTDSKHAHPVAPNVVARDFLPPGPNRTWAGDITYVWTAAGWLYLAVVLDLFSRRVIGWSMGERIDRQLPLAALDMALTGRAAPALYHSDRGSQYASEDYQRRLAERGITCSMSRKGNCWDNAVVESFFSSLKMELVHTRSFRTREEARLALFEYIEVFYNRKRLHSSLGYVSPAEYEHAADAQRLAA
jgi:putative transposase